MTECRDKQYAEVAGERRNVSQRGKPSQKKVNDRSNEPVKVLPPEDKGMVQD